MGSNLSGRFYYSSFFVLFQPKIVFDPATLVPGAKPPQRLVEPPPVSFDDPAPVQTLTNPNKVRSNDRYYIFLLYMIWNFYNRNKITSLINPLNFGRFPLKVLDYETFSVVFNCDYIA